MDVLVVPPKGLRGAGMDGIDMGGGAIDGPMPGPAAASSMLSNTISIN